MPAQHVQHFLAAADGKRRYQDIALAGPCSRNHFANFPHRFVALSMAARTVGRFNEHDVSGVDAFRILQYGGVVLADVTRKHQFPFVPSSQSSTEQDPDDQHQETNLEPGATETSAGTSCLHLRTTPRHLPGYSGLTVSGLGLYSIPLPGAPHPPAGWLRTHLFCKNGRETLDQQAVRNGQGVNGSFASMPLHQTERVGVARFVLAAAWINPQSSNGGPARAAVAGAGDFAGRAEKFNLHPGPAFARVPAVSAARQRKGRFVELVPGIAPTAFRSSLPALHDHQITQRVVGPGS
jgi:hypothetical protein